MSRNPRKLKSGESYKKVSSLIQETEDFKNYIAIAKRRLATPSIVKWDFQVDYSGVSYPILVVGFGENEENVISGFHHNKISGGEFQFECRTNFSMVFHKKDLEKIILDNFGVIREGERKPRVPTYFCKPDRLLQMMWEDIHQEFYNLETEFQEASKKICLLVAEDQSGDEYKSGLRKAREDHVVEKIVECLDRWAKDASPEVLKRALDSYVMHEIMKD